MTQAKDVDATRFLEAVEAVNHHAGRWAHWWDIEPEFPDVPPKVLRAKGRALIRQGRLEGCDCGRCRGDLWIPGWRP